MGFVRESRPSFGSNYDDQYDEAMDRAGLGLSSSTTAANDSNTEKQFAKGNSKYYKTVLFTKSSSSVDLSKGNIVDLLSCNQLLTIVTQRTKRSLYKKPLNKQ